MDNKVVHIRIRREVSRCSFVIFSFSDVDAVVLLQWPSENTPVARVYPIKLRVAAG